MQYAQTFRKNLSILPIDKIWRRCCDHSRAAHYITFILFCQGVILYKNNRQDLVILPIDRVALVRSHFKPLCVLRTIYIAGGRSLRAISVPRFQFTVLLRQLVTSQLRPFEWYSVGLHSYSAKVRLLHPRFMYLLYQTYKALSRGFFKLL